MIDRRALFTGAAALGANLLPLPAWSASCGSATSRASGMAASMENAQGDIDAGRALIGGHQLRNGSARQPYSISKVGSDLRHLRFETRTGDRAIWDVKNGAAVDRAEVVCSDKTGRFPYGTTFWWSFSMLIEDGPEITGDWCAIGQLHQSGINSNGAGANPPFSIGWHTEGARGLSILTRASSTAAATRPYIRPTTVYTDNAYPRGQWVRWIFEFRFAWEGGAVFRAWRNGTQVVDRSGPGFKMGYEWDAGPQFGTYCQFGIYRASAMGGNAWRSPDPSPMVVHFADFDISQVKPSCLR